MDTAVPTDTSFLQPWLGQRIRIECALLAGRNSTLYQARDRLTGAPLIVRKLAWTAELDPNGVERLQLLREGRLLARLRHRNLPHVLQTVDDGGHIFLVIDEFSGNTLETFVQQSPHPLESETVRRCLEQFLSVLEYTHGQTPPIIHRDLRPETVMITPHGVLKLAEFDLARMTDVGASTGTAFRGTGSALYAAPEQLAGDPSHPRHDLYAVGAILYFMATGTAPPPSLERGLKGDTLTPLAEARPDFHPALAGVITRLLEPDPEQRPESVAAVRLLLASEAPASLPQVLAEPDAPPPAEPAVVTTDGAAAPPPAERPSHPWMSSWRLFFRGRKASRAAAQDTRPADSYRESFPEIDIGQLNIDRERARLLPEHLCRAIEGICIGQPGPEQITVAVKDPSVYTYDAIAFATHGAYHPRLVRGEPAMIDLALEFVYRNDQLAPTTTWGQYLVQRRLDTETLEVTSTTGVAFSESELDGSVVAAVDRLIKESIASGASDIHIEPFEAETILRYRVDGLLYKIDAFPPEQASSMVKRIKVLAAMDIAQERVTQGGRISLRIGGQAYDLRVSLLPVPNGESVVMRILKKGAFNLRLADLGFDPDKAARYERLLAQPYGMILVCGPTGSGKSTTLYASLKEVHRPDRKLLTVEDPIEYEMPGIIQVQVNTAAREEDKRVTFSRALREFLRQDPDVILVGEIRDPETAAISIQAALTGHMLLSTLHTNDAIGIVPRLVDMGCEPFLIGSTLIGALGQRLARRICPDCSQEIPVPDELLPMFTKNDIVTPRMFRGTGCSKCFNTGYRGRLGIYELVEINADMRTLINRNAPAGELLECAIANGFRPLVHDGMQKVVQGLLTIEEVQRVCKTL